jgi:hypothetical protein
VKEGARLTQEMHETWRNEEVDRRQRRQLTRTLTHPHLLSVVVRMNDVAWRSGADAPSQVVDVMNRNEETAGQAGRYEKKARGHKDEVEEKKIKRLTRRQRSRSATKVPDGTQSNDVSRHVRCAR